MSQNELEQLREQIGTINEELLELLNRRADRVIEIHKVKRKLGMPTFVPEREQQMLNTLVEANKGPFSDETIRRLFKEIFKASINLMESAQANTLCIGRARSKKDRIIRIKNRSIGGEAPIVIAGPCAVESIEQMEQIGALLNTLGVHFVRGGAFKPRSSPYSFQGLKQKGLEILSQISSDYGLITVTEVTDPRAVDEVIEHADILQVGSRNMYNYDLLRELGRCDRPILLKRGLSATVDEFLLAAEYIALEGNEQVMMCERGIRTFEKKTRFTLDISAVPLIRQSTVLPVIVDVSHAAGRRDILAPLGRAALAAGAQGLMVEIHPDPSVARSDGHQQLDFEQFRAFLEEVGLSL